MKAFPLIAATLEQGSAYGRYWLEKRDPGVAVFGLAFLAICVLPAFVLDLLALPIRLHEWLRGLLTRNRNRQQASLSLSQKGEGLAGDKV